MVGKVFILYKMSAFFALHIRCMIAVESIL